jgi:hypothetical protein
MRVSFPGYHTMIEIGSRIVMQVTISSEASPTPSADGKPLLDINVATPNGVSNHLLIKMRPADPSRKRPEEAKPAKHPNEENSEKPADDRKPEKPSTTPAAHDPAPPASQAKTQETKSPGQ